MCENINNLNKHMYKNNIHWTNVSRASDMWVCPKHKRTSFLPPATRNWMNWSRRTAVIGINNRVARSWIQLSSVLSQGGRRLWGADGWWSLPSHAWCASAPKPTKVVWAIGRQTFILVLLLRYSPHQRSFSINEDKCSGVLVNRWLMFSSFLPFLMNNKSSFFTYPICSDFYQNYCFR